MKKTLLISALLVIATSLFAQTAVITFTTTDHDFGKVNEDDGKVTTIFEFTNQGMEPILLTNVRASCGCTTPKWPHEPIEPGAKGAITVTYNPKGRPGKFTKTVTVTYASVANKENTKTEKLTIRGEVIPAAAKPANQYNVKMGDLSLKSKTMNFGKLKMGENKTITIQYANLTDHNIKVDILVNNNEQDFLVPVLSFQELEPTKEGTLNINFDSKVANIYGPINTKVYMVVNGEKKLEDAYAININADVEEDFSQLTTEDLQKAPILEYQHEVNFGTVKATGKPVKANVHFSNAGMNPLMLRRVVNRNEDIIKVAVKKTTLKNGKAADLQLELNPAELKAGQYQRQIELITNDPKQPRVRVILKWVVE